MTDFGAVGVVIPPLVNAKDPAVVAPITDAATVALTFRPYQAAVSGRIYLKFTQLAAEHHCIFNPNFEGYAYNRWTAAFTQRWTGDAQNRWVGTLSEGGEPNPC
jgi:hypothetical protein